MNRNLNNLNNCRKKNYSLNNKLFSRVISKLKSEITQYTYFSRQLLDTSDTFPEDAGYGKETSK